MTWSINHFAWYPERRTLVSELSTLGLTQYPSELMVRNPKTGRTKHFKCYKLHPDMFGNILWAEYSSGDCIRLELIDE